MLGISILLVAIIGAGVVSAGVGIRYNEQNVRLVAGEEKCLQYGVYNPFDGDAFVEASVSSELDSYVYSIDSDPILIPANTGSSETISISICLTASGSACSDISTEGVSGQVILREVSGPGIEGGSGSVGVASVSAPLKVFCEEGTGGGITGLNIVYLSVIILLVVLIVILFVVRFAKKGQTSHTVSANAPESDLKITKPGKKVINN